MFEKLAVLLFLALPAGLLAVRRPFGGFLSPGFLGPVALARARARPAASRAPGC